jgi:sulfur-carrier protein
VRVELPFHLRQLAGVRGEVRVEVARMVTLAAVLDELERMYPMLRGTVREYGTGARRAYLRFFAGEEDLSFMGMEEELPQAVRSGREVLVVLGAISGG